MSPALIEALAVLAVRYGPEFVTGLISIFKNPNATLADIDALFANVKPYEAYNIPNVDASGKPVVQFEASEPPTGS